VEDYTVLIDPGETEGGGEEVVVLNLCDSEATNASYEWIQKVDFASSSNDSGTNGGFGDFTNQVVDLSTGPNPVTLTPGFKYSSYNEYWNIWIDLDQDHNFSANELLYSGSSRETILTEIQIPDEALPGNTGMRVSMKYGASPAACGTFTWGEVEDYTVNIAGSNNDTTPPVVSSTNPANNAKKVPVNTLIKVGFSEPMDESSVTGGIYAMCGSGNVPGTVKRPGW
jgi:hypothetical protein